MNWFIVSSFLANYFRSGLNLFFCFSFPRSYYSCICFTECVIERLLWSSPDLLFSLTYDLFLFSTLDRAHGIRSYFTRLSRPFPNALSAVPSTPWPVCQPLFPWQLVRKPRPIICSSETHAWQTARSDDVPPLSKTTPPQWPREICVMG